MAVVTVPIRIRATRSGIRPMDPRRDLMDVVELITLGFGEELDPQGQKMLDQMRRVAQRGFWAQLFYGDLPGPDGYVWVEEGRVVGNLSLRRASPHWRQGWMIGNVAVHPDYRGQGIGRALMTHALEAVEAREGGWIGLEVRADNEIARGLYERLGFVGVGETHHLIRPGEISPPATRPPRLAWRPSHPQDASLWLQLATKIYGRRQREVLEIRPALYAFGGWEHRLNLWLRGQQEKAWLGEREPPRRAVHVHSDCRYRFYVWELMLDPEAEAMEAEDTIAQAWQGVGRFARWPIIIHIEKPSSLLPRLEEEGFQHHRTLLQMYLEI